MGNNKKKNQKTFFQENSATDFVKYIFLSVIFGVYPWYLDNKYFNITVTRYKFFVIASSIFVLFMIAAYVIERMLKDYYKVKPMEDEKKEFVLWKPEVWALAFLGSNFFAWLFSIDRFDSLNGESGRYMGLTMYLVLVLVFLLLADYNSLNFEVLAIIFSITSGFAYYIAIEQHRGLDPLALRAELSAAQYDIFLSTFGNINIVASFLALSLPCFAAIIMFSNKVELRGIASIALLMGSMTLMIANSDSAYLGTLGAMFVLLFVAIYKARVRSYSFAVLIITIGNLITVLMNQLVIKEYDKRGGVAEALDNLALAVLFVVISACVFGLTHLVKMKYGEKLENVNRKKMLIILGCASGLAVVSILAYGLHAKWSILTFDYKWGTYRGYIWSKCMELFKDGSFGQKLFGYGNETLKGLMEDRYSLEMTTITGKVYDNAHNEVLQYLVTLGLFGAITYVGLFVSSFVYILRNGRENLMAFASLAAMTGYFVQGLINLNQPITTPFLFVFMGLGVGAARQSKFQGGQK